VRIAEQGIKRLAVMGSMHEIGYWEGAIDENTPCNPLSQYGVAKNALRQSLSLSLKDKINLQWLRAYYIYGDDKRASSVFAKIIAAAERGDELFPFTSGKNKYDFITVDGLARQIAACVLQEKINGTINCCTGEPKTLAEQTEDFIKQHDFKIKLDYGAFPDRPYDSPGVWGDSTKIEDIMQNAE
jgi:dTDP-6-deoxy-L-talose 4-dehydrogenase (NAD+)